MTKNKRRKASKATFSKPKVKKARQKTDVSKKRSFDLARKNLGYFGNLFAEDKPGTLSVSARYRDHPIPILLNQAENVLFLRGSSNRQTDSIQEDLIDNMRQSGLNNIGQQYADARKSARRILFDLYIMQIEAYLNDEGGNLKRAINRALLIYDPNILYSSTEISDFVADGIVKEGSKFLRRLSDDFRNAERRSFRLAFDPVTWIMALNWTNPHCPLWLMERVIIFKACNSLHPGFMTQDAVNKRLKTNGLRTKSASRFSRASKCPIKDIVISDDTQIIQGFVLCEKSLKGMDERQYPFSHHTLIKKIKKVNDKKTQEVNSALQELNATVKNLGVETEEAAKAILDFVSKFDEPQTQSPGYWARFKKRSIRKKGRQVADNSLKPGFRS